MDRLAERLRDFEHLALVEAVRLDRLGDIERDAQVVDDLLSLLAHPVAVDDAAAGVVGDPPQVEVLVPSEIRDDVLFLFDNGDTALGGVAGTVDLNRFATDHDPPVGRLVDAGQQLQQRALAGTVLPDEANHLAGPYLE